MNEDILLQDIKAFIRGESSFTFKYDAQSFCKTTTDSLLLYCLCRSTWIDGTTSEAIYGKNRKEFNSHICCKCGNWFHNYCLYAFVV